MSICAYSCTPVNACQSKCYQGFQCGPSLVADYYCPTSNSQVVSLPSYDNDAAAGTAGLTSGRLWKTSSTNTLGLPAGVVMVKQ